MMLYSPTILHDMTGSDDAILQMLLLYGFFLAGILPSGSPYLANRPKLVLATTFVTMALGLLGVLCFAKTNLLLTNISFILFAVSYGLQAPLDFIYPNQLFATQVRGSLVGAVTAISRIGATGAAFIFPVLEPYFELSALFGAGLFVLALGFMISVKFAPADRVFHQTARVFGNKKKDRELRHLMLSAQDSPATYVNHDDCSFFVDSDAPVRDKLLAKAKEFIVENGIQNLSHERLAKACGISKGACLHYFPSKAALWDKLIEDFVAHLDSQFNKHLQHYEDAGAENPVLCAYRDWFNEFRANDYEPWRNLGYQFMTLGSDKEEFVAPLREWYQKLYKRAMESVPEKDKWMVVMLLMTFDHMFIMRKLGYHALSRDEEDHVIDTIMKTAAGNGLSMQSAGSLKD